MAASVDSFPSSARRGMRASSAPLFHGKRQQKISGSDAAVMRVAGIGEYHAAGYRNARVAHGASVGFHAIQGLKRCGGVVLPNDLTVSRLNELHPAGTAARDENTRKRLYG